MNSKHKQKKYVERLVIAVSVTKPASLVRLTSSHDMSGDLIKGLLTPEER